MTQIAKDVVGIDRNELLQPKEKASNNANQRIPLVINWLRKFKGMTTNMLFMLVVIPNMNNNNMTTIDT